jgi:glucose/arabinose dehydrogenase/Ca2+-binding RTX toxin-like protein
MRVMVVTVMGLIAGLGLVAFLHEKPASAVTPAGFTETLVASVGSLPSGLTFTPDGRMLVLLKTGQVRVYKDGNLLQTPALDISSKLCTNSERGLLGVAVDPDFGTPGNNYVYLFYTFNKHGVCPFDQPTNSNNPVNRVSRFVMSGDTINPLSEEVLIDNIHSPKGSHNAGDLSFGKDGYLYATVGNGGCDYAGNSGCAGRNDASRDPHVLLGKVLRITRNGEIPPDNPFIGASSEPCGINGGDGRTDSGKHCQETFAWGLRNPFRFAFDPNASGTRFFINDVGQAAWEEVDQGKAGADYAWNLCEGTHDNPVRDGSVNCSAAPYTPPIHEYSHNTGCSAITGGAFVPNGAWPAAYDNSYLYGDYVCGKIFELKPKSGGGFTQSEFASGLGQGGPIDMAFGPHGAGQALYYVTAAAGGEVRRIAPTTSANRPPTAVVTANLTSGQLPLTVEFDGSTSNDPDAADTLSAYLWDFGDGSQTETTTPKTSHTYSTKGTYTASLTVRDNHGAPSSNPATVRIDAGNEAPKPVIESPPADQPFKVGEQITLSGSATDLEDGQLQGESLKWEVLRHHTAPNPHTHPPFFSGTGTNLTFDAPEPEDPASTGAGNHLEVRLTATDSNGFSKTVTQEVQPKRVDVSFETNPRGLSVQIEGETFTDPKTQLSWEDYALNVNAPSPQTRSGTTYVFFSWSDGGAQSHDIATGSTPSTYTATFTPTSQACTKTGTSNSETISGTSGADVICGRGGNDTIKGLGGNDTLLGEGGNDTLLGGTGDDTLNGGTGTDNASYSESLTAVTASLDTNSATGEGSDTFLEVENLLGSSKPDSLTGSVTNNTLTGGGGGDNVIGLGGADTLKGGGGADTVNSKDDVSGNDSLDGGAGTDTKVTDATERSIVNFP